MAITLTISIIALVIGQSSVPVANSAHDPAAVLTSIQRAALVSAEEWFVETFTVNITDYPWPIQAVFGEEATVVAVGTVQARLDLTKLGPQAIKVSDGRTGVVAILPEPQLTKPNLDLGKSQIISLDPAVGLPYLKAVIEIIAGEDPNERTRLLQDGETRIAAAAQSSNLLMEAKDGARNTLTQILAATGFKNIQIRFEGRYLVIGTESHTCEGSP